MAVLRRFSDRSDCQKLLTSIGVRLSGSSFFEFGIAEFSLSIGLTLWISSPRAPVQSVQQHLFFNVTLSPYLRARFERVNHDYQR